MRQLQIDATTIADLEVFSTGDGNAGLFQLLDRTMTNVGRAALRRRFAQPSAEIDMIRETQAGVRFLQLHGNEIALDENLLDTVGRYMGSNIMLGAKSRIAARAEKHWMRLRYRELFKEVENGVRATTLLFELVRRISERLSAKSPPSSVANLLLPLAATSKLVLEASNEPLLQTDRILRLDLRNRIESSLLLIGELDAMASMATATTEFGWGLPVLQESDSFLLDAEGVHHPFVAGAVSNPVRLSGGEPLVFLTGPNMAGKTTYLRSVALVVLLAQVGMGVPATRARLTPVENLFTSLNPADNLRAGLSYFYAEVLRVKEAATILADGRRALVLFDEVFKGTNVLDALEASAEVILGFAEARRSGFIFSSHLTQLVQPLRSNRTIRFCYFDGEIVKGVPRYHYALRDGVSEQRFGLLLLRQAQVPELIARIRA